MNKNKEELRSILNDNPDLEIKFLASAVTEDDYPNYMQDIVKIKISDYLEVDGRMYTNPDEYGEYLCNEQDIPLEEAYKIAEALSNKIILVILST